jgi:DNA polymerase III epsilon subunit
MTTLMPQPPPPLLDPEQRASVWEAVDGGALDAAGVDRWKEVGSMGPLGELPADRVPLAVLDFETTGLRVGKGDRVVEIGVVRVDPDRAGRWVETRYESLVNPERDIPTRVVRIHGINDEMVRTAPRFEAVADELFALLEGAVIVGHNAAFDLAFLDRECARAGIRPPTLGPVLDTLQISRHVFGFFRCNLVALAERMDIAHRRAHTALGDAETTLFVLRKMLDSLSGDREGPTVRELDGMVQALRRGGIGRARMIELIKAAHDDNRDLEIDYTDVHGQGAISNRRRITVQNLRLPYVDAFCHLREAERVFRIDRITRVVDLHRKMVG